MYIKQKKLDSVIVWFRLNMCSVLSKVLMLFFEFCLCYVFGVSRLWLQLAWAFVEFHYWGKKQYLLASTFFLSSEDYIKRGKLASNFLLRVVFTFSGLASTFSVYHHILDDISNEYGNEKNTFWHEKNLVIHTQNRCVSLFWIPTCVSFFYICFVSSHCLELFA